MSFDRNNDLMQLTSCDKLSTSNSIVPSPQHSTSRIISSLQHPMCNLDLWFRSKGSSSNQDAAIDVSDFSGPPTFQSTGMSCENLDYSLTSDVSRTSGSSQTSKSYHFDYRKYSRVRKWTVGLSGGKDLIAVIRASGRISHARGLNVPRSGIVGEQFIEKIHRVRESKRFKAVVIRIDSPGGDALASDLMWREIRLLAASKPVIASMADVAASGGYYMAMATGVIVAEDLTLTGSIGVVTGEPSNSHSYGFFDIVKAGDGIDRLDTQYVWGEDKIW
ncbi:hypothetical protein HYC85_019031 [Camellia sinensis]|uniref:Peptidase S49 domain-containing protein n=1 Tax=Camellia sinensis TaxID=4442 RepID=A0A7J7GZM5_CAMSI|nr:hypothetical protein HYC85_019031 [Camellia sinensis]